MQWLPRPPSKGSYDRRLNNCRIDNREYAEIFVDDWM